MTGLAKNAPLWLRVALYATEHQDRSGTVFLEPGQLREAMGVAHRSRSSITRAVTLAVRNGWLRPGSSARVLWVSEGVQALRAAGELVR